MLSSEIQPTIGGCAQTGPAAYASTEEAYCEGARTILPLPFLDNISFVLAAALAIAVLWEVFETIVLPRRVNRRFRVTRYYYVATWNLCCLATDRIHNRKQRSELLSIFGPLSLLGLFAIWGLALAFAFALMNWSIHSQFKVPEHEVAGFAIDLYVSGTTITTLGLGDVTPQSGTARLLTVIEGGLGLGLVALVISYLPALYQAFSRREIDISLLDARAGSPPTAAELLARSATTGRKDGLELLLATWERWCAEIMESHISYPVLCFFRSQHANQNWITAITAILDTCALLMACLDHDPGPQASLTFAMARHAMVDISQVFHRKPDFAMAERLSSEEFRRVCAYLKQKGFNLRTDDEACRKLNELRRQYEPYVAALGRQLRMDLPPWSRPAGTKDNWLATKWRVPE